MLRKIALFISLIFVGFGCFAQMPSFKTSIDKQTIVLGEQFHVKLEVNIPHNTFNLQSLSIPDSIPHFELIGKGKSDSIHGDASTTFTQVLNFTSFDSGSFVLPQFKLNFLAVDKGKVYSGFTDTFKINVTYNPIDSIKPFHDIHTVIDVKNETPLWVWLALIDGILLLIAIIIYLIKKFKKKPSTEVFASKLTPLEEAIKNLNDLKEKRLLEQGNVKEFHTSLVSIFKRFLSRKISKDITSLTTSETLLVMEQAKYGMDNTSVLAATLRMADAVKFAKYQPSLAESDASLNQTKMVVEKIDNLNAKENAK